ncbi:uncharacterized protein LOC112092717 [Morus notabilis]|uniref:uncharacterized protein LOC112092717 n=1 Tax=Morus notabilis TaxID=981085 RepID=UPI000CED19D7|nr:uncharacterized protein LOC112092717 [Morus notabilis]
MKASVKFRDDQKPLFRAKVPLSILGLPFQSGIVAGESKELTLNLGTFFESGPSIRIAYRPNDTWNPFSLVVKTGTGHFGSPAASSMLMSAEFNLLGRGNPRFMLNFKPRFGDFSIRKSQSSVFDNLLVKPQNGTASEDDNGSIEVVESPMMSMNGSFAGKKIALFPSDTSSIAGLFSGMDVTARTAVPVRNRAAVNFRWGVRVPAEIKSVAGNPTAGISLQKIPFLVMNKIGIEHVDGPDPKMTAKAKPPSWPENADVAEACFTVKRQLEVMQAENGLLRKAVEDLRREFVGASPAGSFDSGKYREFDLNGSKTPKSDRRSSEKKAAEAEASEELKKALKGA